MIRENSENDSNGGSWQYHDLCCFVCRIKTCEKSLHSVRLLIRIFTKIGREFYFCRFLIMVWETIKKGGIILSITIYFFADHQNFERDRTHRISEIPQAIRKKFKNNLHKILEKLRLFVYNVFCRIILSRRFDMNGIKGYISIREASYRRGVSERRVNQYCAEGRIPGASRFGRSWAIPDDAKKPSDPRKAKIRKTIRRDEPCQNQNGI